MRQHAALGRHVELEPQLLEHGEERVRPLRAVGGGIDADDGIAGAEQKAVENAGGNAGEIVGRMIGLQPHRQPAGQPDGVAEARDHRAFRRHHHEILQPADLAHRRRHLRRDPGRERGERVRGRCVRQQPVAQSADREMGDHGKRRMIVAVDDEPRHLVALVRNHLLGEEGRKRQVGERVLRRHALFARCLPRRRRARRRCAAARPWPAAS